jgi:hypothetical protein
MKKLLILFCLIASQFETFAQAEAFEGVLVYGRKFYKNSKRIDTEDPNIPPIMSFTVKGNLSLAEIVTEKDFMTAMNYSVIKDAEKKEATMLARIANQKMAVKFDASYFNTSKLYQVVSANEPRIDSEFGKQDTMRVWYTTSYKPIPYQFETLPGPGLIVSMQQDDVSYWELKEIRKENIDPLRFGIPKDYFIMTQEELQDFVSTLDQFKIEEEQDPMEQRGNEINHEEED